MLSGVPSVGAPDILPRYEHTELAAQRRSPVSNVSPVQQVKGEDAPPAVTLTKTHSGHLAKLHTVGENLDKNLTITDRNGQVQAGVGIRFQEERNYGIYVAGLTPKGPADASGKIQEADILISVDGYNIQQHDRIETVRKLVLGPPASIVTMTFERRPKTGDYHTYTVQLRRSGESQVKKRPAFEPGFVGLMVSPDLPHAVSAVHDLVDINGVVQGAPGYQNERVDAGDFIVSINNQDAQRLSVDDLHELLRGELHSAVEIVLQRKKTMAVYTVKVLRHRKHEYSKPPVAAEPLPTAVKLSDDQVKHAPSQSAIIPGWHKVIDTMGRPYYVNHDTKQWSWEDPALEVLGTPVSLPQAGASAASPQKGASAAYPEKAPTVVKLQTVQTPGAIAQVDTLGGPLPSCAGKPPPKSPQRQGQPSSPGPRPRVSFSKNVEEQVPGTPPKQPHTGSVSPLVRPALIVRPPPLGELPEGKSNARKEDPARPVPLGADRPPTDRQLVRMDNPPVIFQVAFVLSVLEAVSYISLPRILLPLLLPHLCTSIFSSLMPKEFGCMIFRFDSCESLPV